MTRDEAKEILSAYRECDAQDPAFAEALALAKQDPELADWFARERAFDGKLRAAIRSVKPPRDFRAALRAQAKLIPFRTPPVRWVEFSWLAAAAAVVVLLSALAFGFKETRPRMAALAERVEPLTDRHQHPFDAPTAKMETIRNWFAAQGAPSDFQVPAGLMRARGVGCEVVGMDHAKVSLLCFSPGKGRVAHLYVVDRDQLADAPMAGAGPVMAKQGPYAVAMWSDDKHTYLLAERGSVEDLKSIL